MFDKFAKIDAKKEEDYKRREKPIEINDWKDSKKDRKETETLSVKGDIQMDMDLTKAIDEHEADQMNNWDLLGTIHKWRHAMTLLNTLTFLNA